MTSIDRISTSLNLTGTTGSISRSSNSNNKNLGARVDGVHVAFSRSYLRINEAVDSTTITKEALENILNITEELISIAEEAKKRSASNSKRSRLNREFQNLVDDFRDIIEDAEKNGVNLLDAEDLKEVFSEAGLDTSNVEAMAEVFNRIAGKDEQLGIEPIRSRRVSLTEKEKRNRRATINVGQTEEDNDGTFNASTTISTGGVGTHTKVADFDGDGELDLFRYTQNGLGFSVELGNGDGTFNSPSFSSNTDIYDATFFDYNGDSILDAIITDSTSGSIATLTGNGDGTFDYNLLAGFGPSGITTIYNTDVDGDNNIDLLVTHGDDGGNSVSVYRGNGDGTFEHTSTTTVGLSPEHIALADYNSDGILDAAVTDQGGISILTGNGSGSFTVTNTLSIPGAHDIASYDFNNDGRNDIVALSQSTNSAQVFMANGDGTFAAAVTYQVGALPDELALTDINGDGNIDIITNSPSGNDISIILGNGDGTFNESITLSGPSSVNGLSVGDFNSDGADDLLTTGAGGDINLLLGNTQTVNIDDLVGNGTYTKIAGGGSSTPSEPEEAEYSLADPVSYDTNNGPTAIELYDFDGDGELDIVTANAGASGTGTTVGVQLGNGDGTFQVEQEFEVGGGIQDLTGGQDFNGDGNIDIITGATTSSSDVTFSLSTGLGDIYRPTAVLADVNGDGLDDLIDRNDDIDGLQISLANSDGTLQAPTEYTTGTTAAYFLSSIHYGGDYDGDGNGDLAVIHNDYYGDKSILLSTGNGDGTFNAFTTVLTVAGSAEAEAEQLIISSDYDNDGNDDLAFVIDNGVGSELFILGGNGDLTFEEREKLNISSRVLSLDNIDIGTTGVTDLLVGSAPNNSSSIGLVQVFEGVGDGTFNSTTYSENYGTVAQSINASAQKLYIIDDIDNDGNNDIIGVGNGTTAFRLGTGDGDFGSQTTLSSTIATANAAVLDDLDGDGNKDIIISGNSQFGVLYGNGNGTFNAILSYSIDGANAGSFDSADIKIADFDKDGSLDVFFVGEQGAGGNDFAISYANGDGTFSNAISYEFGIVTESGTIGDIDNDGNVDAVLGTDNFTYIAYGNGDGTFSSVISVDIESTQVVAKDLDGDGNIDLIGSSSNDIEVRFGNGDGTFGVAIQTNVAGPINDTNILEVVDFDGDGNEDIFIEKGTSWGSYLLKGNGDGTFLAAYTFNASNQNQVGIGDINNDGQLDLLYDTSGAQVVSVISSTTPYDYGTIIDTSVSADNIEAGDLNNDGKVEIAIGRNIYTNTSGTTFSSFGSAPLSFGSNDGLEFADINGDGLLDLIGQTGSRIYYSISNGDGTFNNATSVTVSQLNNGLAVGDVNGDGFDDLYHRGDLLLSNGGGTTSSLQFLAGNGDGTLNNAISIGVVGSDFSDIVQADLDTDGNQDIITANGIDGSVTYLTGNGNGTFNTAQTLNVGGSVASITTLDADGDGNLDILATSSNGSGEVQLFRGNGNGTFNAASTFSASGDADISKVITADLDGDGNDDIITDGNSSINVQYGNGDGTFAAETIYNTGSAGITDLRASDIDGDGSLDIVIASNGGDTVQRMMGNGDRTFEAAITEASGTNYEGLAVADLNGDGLGDVVASDLTNSEVDVLLGNSNAVNNTSYNGLDQSSSANTSTGPTSIELYDFDGDGELDIVTANAGASGTGTTVGVQLGNGDGTFQVEREFDTGIAVQDVAGGSDLDGDGNIDFVTAHNGTVGGGGIGELSTSNTFSVTNGAQDVDVYDLNNDGNLDLILGVNSSGRLDVQLGNGDGTFSIHQSFSLGGDVVEVVGTDDLNGDGFADIVAAVSPGAGNDYYAILNGDGTGSFTIAATKEILNDFSSGDKIDFYTGDINSDGNLDLISLTENGTNSLVSAWLGNGDNTFQNPFEHEFSGTLEGLALSDHNNDGAIDIAASSLSGDIHVFTGNGDGTFQAQTPTILFEETALGGAFDNYVVGYNIDGIGNDDTIATRTTTDEIQIRLSTGSLTFSTTTFDTIDAPHRFDIHDINGDGNEDLVVLNQSGEIGIHFGNGNGTFNAATTIDLGLAASLSTHSSIKIGETNGDGNVDIFIAGEMAGADDFIVLTGNGDGTFNASSYHTAGGTDAASSVHYITDLNGDGDLDIVYRKSGSLGHVALSNGDGTFGVSTTLSGLSNPTVISSVTNAADIDGDGNIDLLGRSYAYGTTGLAVFRGNGDGTFSYEERNDAADITDITGKLDIDSDGNLDFIFSDSVNNRTTILFGNGDGSFDYTTHTTDDTFISNAVGDFDGDGNVNDFLSGTYVYNYDPHTELHGDRILSAASGTLVPESMTVGDFDNDGFEDDYVGLGTTSTGLFIYTDGSETPTSKYNTGYSVNFQNTTVGDFNNDGNQDIALIGGSDTQVYFGNGNSTFRALQSFDLGGGIDQGNGVSGDFNNDGFEDLLVSDTTNDVVRVALASTGSTNAQLQLHSGNGDGNFETTSTIELFGNEISQVVLADVDNDGNQDIITANGADGTVSYLTGNGNGTFNAVQTLNVGGNVASVTTLDADGDGNLDILATSSNGSGEVQLFRGNGNGNFNAASTFSASGDADVSKVITADLDGDGNDDIITDGNSSINVQYGNGDGTFAAETIYNTGSAGITDLRASDIDGDGSLDIVIASNGGDTVQRMMGNGDRTFGAAITEASGANYEGLAVGDLNSDGVADVVASDLSNSEVDILLGNSSAETEYDGLTQGTSADTSAGPTSIELYDFDGDGELDIVTTNAGASGNGTEIGVQLGNGDGTFQVEQQFDTEADLQDVIGGVDIDGDSNIDLIAANEVSLGSSVAGTYNLGSQVGSTAQLESHHYFDYNGDGNLDLLVAGTDNYDVFYYHTGNGDGTFALQQTFSSFTYDARNGHAILGGHDYDGDGTEDAAIMWDRYDEKSEIQVLSYNSGTDTFSLGSTTYLGEGAGSASDNTPSYLSRTADLNNDGDTDILAVTEYNGQYDIDVALSNGNGTFSIPTQFTLSNIGSLDFYDYNSDGNLDLVLGEGSNVSVFTGNGDGTFRMKNDPDYLTQQSLVTTATAAESVNFDGAGRDDIISLTGGDVRVSLVTGSFVTSSQSDFDTISNASDLTIADVNGDSNYDVIVTNNSGEIGVHFGNGDGTIQAATTFSGDLSAPTGTSHLYTGDADGDGNLDIFLAFTESSSTTSFSVLYGNGDGTFERGTTYTLDPATHSGGGFNIGDFDEDGNTDVVIYSNNVGSGEKQVLLSNGDRTFRLGESLDTSITPYTLLVADVNNDNDLDIIQQYAYQYAVQLGNGDGTFAAAATVNDVGFGTSSELHIAGDLDNDGNLDLILEDGLMLGNGDGTFKAVSLNDSISTTTPPTFGDYNGDGVDDLFSHYLYTYDPSFSVVGDVQIATDVDADTVVVGDFDNDGTIDDIAVRDGARIEIYNDGSSTPTEITGTQNAGLFASTGDIDNDGNTDLIFKSGANEFRVFRGNGDNTFKARETYSISASGPGASTEFTIADINGDGYDDISLLSNDGPYVMLANGAGAGETLGQVSLLSGNGDGTFSTKVTLGTTGSNVNEAILADINGDGNQDIITANGADGTVTYFTGNGDGTFNAVQTINIGGNVTSVFAQDLDGDGNVDLGVASDNAGAELKTLWGNGDGTFAQQAGSLGTFSAAQTLNTGPTTELSLADINNDGNIDLVTGAFGDDITFSLGNGNGTFDAATTLTVGGNIRSLELIDIDGDGNQDLLYARSGRHYTLLGNGDGSFDAALTFITEDEYGSEYADIDGDGNLDVVMGEARIALGNGDGTFKAVYTVEGHAGGQSPVIGDFNDDGNLDFATANPGSSVKVSLGNGDGTFEATYVTGFNSVDWLESTDFDGDGEDDLVGFRLSGGVTVRDSQGGTFPTIFFNSSSFPQGDVGRGSLADIDGDGNIDIIAPTESGDINIFFGNGNGTFNDRATYASGTQMVETQVVDINGDGTLDIIGADSVGGGTQVMFGQASRQVDWDLSDTPTVVRSVDIDGDGNVDVVAANSTHSTFSVLYSNGDGTFSAEVSYNAGTSGLTDIRVTDLDGDSNLDVVVSGNGGDSVTRIMGTGSRNFAAPVTEASGTDYEGIAVGDLNGDGLNDVVASDLTNSEVDILLGDTTEILVPGGGNGDSGGSSGSGGFVTGSTPTSIAAGDIDGDGITDFITADSADNTLSFLAGNGDGTFVARATLNGGNTPGAVSLTDIDGDGNLDIISSASGSGEVLIQTGNGDGTFNLTTTFSGTTDATEFIAKDINGDGNIDFIANSTSTGNASVFLGNGDGTISAASQFASGTDVTHIASTDLNGDGLEDLITSSATDNQVYVSLGDGSGSFGPASAISAGADISAVTTADINRDGVADIVTGSATEGTASVLYGNGDGTFRARVSHSVGTEVTTLSVTDINEDGKFDILAADDSTDTLNVLTGNADGTFSAARTYSVSDGITHVLTPEMNGDGVEDVALLSSSGNSINTFIANVTSHTNGTGTFASSATFAGQVSSDVELRDVDGDGILDAITADTIAGTVSVFSGNSDGTFNLSNSYSAGGSPEQVRVRDVNNDGIQDIITTNGAQNQIGVLLGNADGSYQAPTNFDAGSNPNDLTLFDINKDGNADIITVNEDSGDLSVFLSNGDGTFNAATTLSAPPDVTSVEAFDADGDGNVDLVAAGKYRIDLLSGNGDGTFLEAQSTQAPGLRIEDTVKVDIDGDGDIDIVAASSREAKVFKNDGTGNFTAGDSYNIGTGVDSIEVTDLNGDGAQDIVANSTQLDTIRILMGYSDGTFQQTSTTLDVGGTTAGLAIGDINDDGAVDIVATVPDQGALFTALALGQDQQAQAQEETTIKETKTVRDVADPDSTDPLDRHVKSRANAIVSSETLEELKEYIEEDLEGIESVLADLKTANTLARNGLLAANSISQDVDSYSTAQEIANTLRNSILFGTKDEALRVYGAFDQIIVSNLLK